VGACSVAQGLPLGAVLGADRQEALGPARIVAVAQPATPDFVRAFAGILQRHNLLPDDWRDYPELALGTAKLSEFYLVQARRRLLGLAWISEIVPGHSC
jgi:hypothetical protein